MWEFGLEFSLKIILLFHTTVKSSIAAAEDGKLVGRPSLQLVETEEFRGSSS